MTRKDFDLIAKALRPLIIEGLLDDKADGAESAAYAISEALLDTNPRFDQVRFLAACGLV